MRNVLLIAAAAALFVACGGANNTNLNPNTISNANVHNVNVSHPETSPPMPPANIGPANGAMNNRAVTDPGMANEKVSPAPSPDKRVPPVNRAVPELKGTPLKKP